jgi:hypothetical protein
MTDDVRSTGAERLARLLGFASLVEMASALKFDRLDVYRARHGDLAARDRLIRKLGPSASEILLSEDER